MSSVVQRRPMPRVAPRERALHIAIAQLVLRTIKPYWRFTHLPMGEYRTPATAGLLKRMGVMPGWPDFIFVGPGLVFFLELKRRGETQSVEQRELEAHLRASGCDFLCTDSFKVAVSELRERGIIRAEVSA